MEENNRSNATQAGNYCGLIKVVTDETTA